MSTLAELSALIGEDEARRFLEATKDWSDELVEAGVKFKDFEALDAEFESLSEIELTRLYTKIGKLLAGPQGRVTDTGGKVIKLLGPKSTKQPALSRSFEAGLADIEAARRGTAEKTFATKTALDLTFDEGMLAIARERGLSVRVTKGKKGRFGGPDFEMTQENIAGIREIMRYREKNQEHPAGGNPIDMTLSESIAEIERHRGEK